MLLLLVKIVSNATRSAWRNKTVKISRSIGNYNYVYTLFTLHINVIDGLLIRFNAFVQQLFRNHQAQQAAAAAAAAANPAAAAALASQQLQLIQQQQQQQFHLQQQQQLAAAAAGLAAAASAPAATPVAAAAAAATFAPPGTTATTPYIINPQEPYMIAGKCTTACYIMVVDVVLHITLNICLIYYRHIRNIYMYFIYLYKPQDHFSSSIENLLDYFNTSFLPVLNNIYYRDITLFEFFKKINQKRINMHNCQYLYYINDTASTML